MSTEDAILLVQYLLGLRRCSLLKVCFVLVRQVAAKNKKILLETAAKLESQVLTPMNELAQSNAFNFQLLAEELAAQTEVLEGKAADARGSGGGSFFSASAAGAGAGAGAASSPLGLGLQRLGESLFDEHEALSARLQSIQTRFQRQKEAVEKLIARVVSKASKVKVPVSLFE